MKYHYTYSSVTPLPPFYHIHARAFFLSSKKDVRSQLSGDTSNTSGSGDGNGGDGIRGGGNANPRVATNGEDGAVATTVASQSSAAQVDTGDGTTPSAVNDDETEAGTPARRHRVPVILPVLGLVLVALFIFWLL